MSWMPEDEVELQECIDRLTNEFNELKSKVNPIENILNISRSIQTITQITYIEQEGKKVESKIKIIPKNKWGENMTDEYRLKTKDECITKTNDLLGKVGEN